MAVYADAQAWADAGHGEPTSDLETLLLTASLIVDELLRGRRYPVDADSLPTDPEDATKLRAATVAIAKEWDDNGSLESGASTTTWSNVKIGSVALSGPSESESAVKVLGLPVPPLALVYLNAVGTNAVTVR